MGAGKSTVGRLLAELMQCLFFDLDEMIVDREQRPIRSIFTTDGEVYFRDCETAVLHALDLHHTAVYATGGGIIMREENRKVMRNQGRIIYLKSTWLTIQKRLQSSTERPLVDREKGWDDVKALWLQRQPFYEDADLVVETDGLTPTQVAQRIVNELRERVTS
jgi:shikimate kinase